MTSERMMTGECGAPFPIYDDLVERLLAAHRSGNTLRDVSVAHILGICAGYAYSGTETFATTACRLGLQGGTCLKVAAEVDAMYIFSTAYLLQSRCGRVVILAYRGTEPSNLGNWLGDADVGSDSISVDGEDIAVHSGFHRNLRATRFDVLAALDLAAEGRSLLDPSMKVESPMEALYVCGHSLGGAMAVLFALSIFGIGDAQVVAERLRAVYTFGQPLAIGGSLPPSLLPVADRVIRHVMPRDIIPSLPATAWGRFVHYGQEYRYENDVWTRSETPVEQLKNLRDVPRALLAMFATARRRDVARYSVTDHGPHHYLSALRPAGRITEFGDRG